MIRMPKTMTSKLPLRPSNDGSQSWSWVLSSVTSAAPTTAPHTLPAPPTTAMNKYSIP